MAASPRPRPRPRPRPQPTTDLGPRASATGARRQAILDAALECFSTLGYDQTTLADIRARSGASTGSIYHHFGSKERIAASLYLEGVRQTQLAGIEALLRTRTARTGVAAQVGAYIDWVVEHPDLARFLFAMRHAPFLDDDEPEIDALNADVHARAASWIADRVAAGELPDLEPAMRWALVFGPCRHWAGSWLRGTTTTSPAVAKAQLATATYAALQSLI
jgi:AcrR family transcriptional regulator